MSSCWILKQPCFSLSFFFCSFLFSSLPLWRFRCFTHSSAHLPRKLAVILSLSASLAGVLATDCRASCKPTSFSAGFCYSLSTSFWSSGISWMVLNSLLWCDLSVINFSSTPGSSFPCEYTASSLERYPDELFHYSEKCSPSQSFSHNHFLRKSIISSIPFSYSHCARKSSRFCWKFSNNFSVMSVILLYDSCLLACRSPPPSILPLHSWVAFST